MILMELVDTPPMQVVLVGASDAHTLHLHFAGRMAIFVGKVPCPTGSDICCLPVAFGERQLCFPQMRVGNACNNNILFCQSDVMFDGRRAPQVRLRRCRERPARDGTDVRHFVCCLARLANKCIFFVGLLVGAVSCLPTSTGARHHIAVSVVFGGVGAGNARHTFFVRFCQGRFATRAQTRRLFVCLLFWRVGVTFGKPRRFILCLFAFVSPGAFVKRREQMSVVSGTELLFFLAGRCHV